MFHVKQISKSLIQKNFGFAMNLQLSKRIILPFQKFSNIFVNSQFYQLSGTALSLIFLES